VIVFCIMISYGLIGYQRFGEISMSTFRVIGPNFKLCFVLYPYVGKSRVIALRFTQPLTEMSTRSRKIMLSAAGAFC
jgi:hypothetical protein